MNMFLKKIAFAIPFLLAYGWFLQLLSPLLVAGANIFSVGSVSFWQLPVVALALLLAGTFYAIFATLADDWTYVTGVAVLSMALPMVFLPAQSGWIMSLGGLVAQMVGFAFLHLRMGSYLTFRTSEVVLPAVKNFLFIVTITGAVLYFLNVNSQIRLQGFQIPDSLVEMAVTMASGGNQASTQTPALSITPEQIQQLRENPELLRQSGLDPKILDSLGDGTATVADASREMIKQAVKDQFSLAIKPYEPVIPWVLALLFYFGVSSFAALGTFIPVILTWLTFVILKRAGIIRFEKETREVEKLVI